MRVYKVGSYECEDLGGVREGLEACLVQMQLWKPRIG